MTQEYKFPEAIKARVTEFVASGDEYTGARAVVELECITDENEAFRQLIEDLESGETHRFVLKYDNEMISGMGHIERVGRVIAYCGPPVVEIAIRFVGPIEVEKWSA